MRKKERANHRKSLQIFLKEHIIRKNVLDKNYLILRNKNL